MKPTNFINSKSFIKYTMTSWAEHLRSIKSHTSRLSYKRKTLSKARTKATAAYNKHLETLGVFTHLTPGKVKKVAPPYTLTFNKKGSALLRINKSRSPQYLTRAEYRVIRKQIPFTKLKPLLKRRKIGITFETPNG